VGGQHQAKIYLQPTRGTSEEEEKKDEKEKGNASTALGKHRMPSVTPPSYTLPGVTMHTGQALGCSNPIWCCEDRFTILTTDYLELLVHAFQVLAASSSYTRPSSTAASPSFSLNSFSASVHTRALWRDGNSRREGNKSPLNCSEASRGNKVGK